MHAAPAETVAADADAVAQRLAVRQHQIKPPLGGVHHDGAGGVIAVEIHGRARDRARAAAEEIGTAAHDVAGIKTLGLGMAGGQQGYGGEQGGKGAGHYSSP